MKLSEKIQEALREQKEINLSDPAVQKRLAAQWGYVPAGAQNAPKAVAYLDLGVGGYMDVGTDLTDEELATLPKGRHMLGVIGTYGVDGYVPVQPESSVNEGVRKVTLGFRWESEAQHHIPTIEIEFDPVSPDSPNDAKGWQDRDRIASMLSPEAKP